MNQWLSRDVFCGDVTYAKRHHARKGKHAFSHTWMSIRRRPPLASDDTTVCSSGIGQVHRLGKPQCSLMCERQLSAKERPRPRRNNISPVIHEEFRNGALRPCSDLLLRIMPWKICPRVGRIPHVSGANTNVAFLAMAGNVVAQQMPIVETEPAPAPRSLRLVCSWQFHYNAGTSYCAGMKISNVYRGPTVVCVLQKREAFNEELANQHAAM